MKRNKEKDLLERYHNGQSTPEESAMVERAHLKTVGDSPAQEDEAAKAEVWQALEENLPRQHSISYSIKYISAAAMVLVLITAGYFIYTQLRPSSTPAGQVADVINMDDVAPGSNRAYLTLADGSRIELDSSANGTLAQQAGMVISKTADGEVVYKPSETSSHVSKTGNPIFNTISTPKGGQYQVILPDGSRVWLNAASSLTFPASFDGASRSVNLTGEAYFEVAHQDDKSFFVLVSNKKQKIEVLGTHFNVNAYVDEPVSATTLLEGKVKVSSEDAAGSVVLKPGQQSILHQKTIKVQPADDNAIAWKEGKLKFSKKDLTSILREVSRWYDLEVVYQGPVSPETITGGVSRQSKLSTVLSLLEGLGVKFRLENGPGGRRLIVAQSGVK